MPDPQKLAEQCAEFMFANDRASQGLGMKIDCVTPGNAQLSMSVCEDMLNGHGRCQGGFVFALADSAFAFACNSYNQVTVGQGCSIDYLKPVKLGERLTAIAQEQFRGRTTGVYDVVVTREDGKRVALFRGTSFSLEKTLLP